VKRLGGILLENYEYISLSYSNDLKNVVLPKFQRTLVWTQKKKNDLINTLHKGYPFGALLVSQTSKDPVEYRLLDGQQRLATIRDYERNKISYWKSLNRTAYENAKDKINEILTDHNQEEITEKIFDELLSPDYELADWTDDYHDEGTGEDKSVKKELRKQVTTIRKSIENYIQLNDLQVPVIRFKGKKSDLPEVFSNLNKGGIPLTKYEILNAAWNDETLIIPSDSYRGTHIINYVKQYYNSIMDRDEFELEGFSEDDITNTRQINLAEFGRALGRFMVERIPALISNSESNSANELGFGMLGIFVNKDNKKISEISDDRDYIQTHLDELLDGVDSISKNLNATFEKMLSQKMAYSNSRSNAKKAAFATGLSTSFKILSYYADLWGESEEQTRADLKNIPAYYIYDFALGSWTAHGDQRLNEYYPKNKAKTYATPISQGQLSKALRSWIDDGSYKQNFAKEVKALITIHANLTYLATTISSGEDYELEHIIPKKRVLDQEDEQHKNAVNLGSLGNGMFLPKTLNNKKKAKTLYEFNETAGVNYRDLIEKSHYFKEEEFDQIFEELKDYDFDGVNRFIGKRADKVIADISKKLSTGKESVVQ